ncbi:unnamed protein product [Ceutorhynchus assimilis]|uniref:Uncharacterized protein n=1 Tax=Ceutorhynchus assimilis TaxID=467358 RepID=A0A9P0GPV8_9CUCU|nr:unnamed protein product [Ceutorhynchus assimilis]
MLTCNQKGFYDLNVHEKCFQNNLRRTLETLYSLGYRTVAVNQLIDVDSIPETKKKKKKGEPRETLDCLPEPFDLNPIKETAAALNYESLTFLNRLTLKFSSQDTLHKYLKSINFKKYDLFGVIPVTREALTFVCSSLEADILSFDVETRLNLRLQRKLFTQLVDRNYHLELTYGPAIEDSTKRKNLINISHLFHTYGKSKNIIFSSGAEFYMHIRNPYDVISLGFLFGLNELQSKNSVMNLPRKVIVNATGRRHGKSVMLVENMDTIVEESVLVVSDEESEDEDMDTDEPLQKKSKQ